MNKLDKLIVFLFMTVFIFIPFNMDASAETAYASISFSSSNVHVGDTVKITANFSASSVGAVRAVLSYDDSVLEYDKDNSPNSDGGSGTVTIVKSASDKQTSMSSTVTFKAIGVGTSFVKLTSEVIAWDYTSLGSPSAGASLTVKNPSPDLSSNANLQSLTPSAGSLSPAFSAGTTNYTVTVPYDTASITFNALAEDSGAKVSKSGSGSLSVGSNTIKFTVLAPDGTQKTYTVNVVRSAKSGGTPPNSSNPGAGTTAGAVSTTDTSGEPETTATAVDPTADYPIVIDGIRYKVITDLTGIDSPGACFTLTSCAINGADVPAYQHNHADVTVVYLMSEENQGAYFIYHTDDASFSAFLPIVVNGQVYVAQDEPADTDFENYVKASVPIGDHEVDAWNIPYASGSPSDFYLVYAVSPDGNTQWYVYDAKENTMQRYFPDAVSAVKSTSSDSQAAEMAGLKKFKTAAIIVMGVLSVLLAGLIVGLAVWKVRSTGGRHLNRW